MTEMPIGRGVVVRPGQRVAILSFGALFSEAMSAGEDLDATVVDMRWVKPLDETLVLELAESHDLIITLEENVVAGGAGSAVAELLSSKGVDCPIRHVGIPDNFVEHGDQGELRFDSGLSRDEIVRLATAKRYTEARIGAKGPMVLGA